MSAVSHNYMNVAAMNAICHLRSPPIRLSFIRGSKRCSCRQRTRKNLTKKAHACGTPDNLPGFAKRKARHLKKLETIQRRLAWPPRRDDIANTEMVRAFCLRCTVLRIATKRIEKLRIARFLSAFSSGSFKMRQQHDPHMTRFVMRLFVPC